MLRMVLYSDSDAALSISVNAEGHIGEAFAAVRIGSY